MGIDAAQHKLLQVLKTGRAITGKELLQLTSEFNKGGIGPAYFNRLALLPFLNQLYIGSNGYDEVCYSFSSEGLAPLTTRLGYVVGLLEYLANRREVGKGTFMLAYLNLGEFDGENIFVPNENGEKLFTLLDMQEVLNILELHEKKPTQDNVVNLMLEMTNEENREQFKLLLREDPVPISAEIKKRIRDFIAKAIKEKEDV